jgi:8-oxo-dGTP pyrophosphatase MutT (NUDIX family)
MRATPLLLPILALLAACAAEPPAPTARLPAGIIQGGTDPMRYAVQQSDYVFNTTAAISAAKRAEAAALVEFVGSNWATDIRWNTPSPGLVGEIAAARRELREALGIAPDAAPQAIVSGLVNASRRLEGDTTGPGLPVEAFPDPARTLARLQAPPPLPATRLATARIRQEFDRAEQERINQSIGGGGNAGRS